MCTCLFRLINLFISIKKKRTLYTYISTVHADMKNGKSSADTRNLGSRIGGKMSHVTTFQIKVCKTPITICTRIKNLIDSLCSSYHKEVWRVCRTLETLWGLIAKTIPMTPQDGGRRLCWKPDVVVLRQFRNNLDLNTGRSGDTADDKERVTTPKGRCAPHPLPAHLREQNDARALGRTPASNDVIVRK